MLSAKKTWTPEKKGIIARKRRKKYRRKNAAWQASSSNNNVDQATIAQASHTLPYLPPSR